MLLLLLLLLLQMAPYVESAERLALPGRELGQGATLALKYASLAAFWGVAQVSGSIWRPLQLVGATAGGWRGGG